ncbi:MAG: hypothetical protein ACYC3I_21025 [Gemmataceae bacterium]
MAKKRTSLDSILTTESRPGKSPTLPAPPLPAQLSKQSKRPGVKQQTVYLPTAVHEQLRRLAFEERAYARLSDGRVGPRVPSTRTALNH